MRKFTIDDINIIYEDNHVIVVVKPQNMPVCPDGSGDIDLLTLLKEYIKDKYDKKGEAFLGLVHRLDRPTGGVMIFARTTKAAKRLSEQLRSGDLEKRYFTVVHGIPKEKQGELVHYLIKNPSKNMVYTVPMATEGAKKAVLQYKTLSVNDKMSLIDIKLKTGRSHQIRVQMSAIGTPLFGDAKYADGRTLLGYNIALWSVELKFFHPITKERLVYRVYPPVDDIPWNYFDINRFLAINIKY